MGAVLGRRRPVSCTIALAPTAPAPHPNPHAMGRRGAVRVVVIAMISSLWTSCSTDGKENANSEVLQWELLFYTSYQFLRETNTIIRWVVSQESGLPLALVGVGVRIWKWSKCSHQTTCAACSADASLGLSHAMRQLSEVHATEEAGPLKK